MIPETETVLNLTAIRLLTEVGPNLPAGYGQGSINTLAMTVFMAAQEHEFAVDVRVWENGEMRRLLKLGSAFGSFASVNDEAASLRVTELNRVNHALRRDLIRLHEIVEETEGDEARALETALLGFLKALGDRRLLKLPAL